MEEVKKTPRENLDDVIDHLESALSRYRLDLKKNTKTIEGRLFDIEVDLGLIAEQLERIANIFETKETRALTLKVENLFNPSNGPFCSQESEESDKESTENEDDRQR